MTDVFTVKMGKAGALPLLLDRFSGMTTRLDLSEFLFCTLADLFSAGSTPPAHPRPPSHTAAFGTQTQPTANFGVMQGALQEASHLHLGVSHPFGGEPLPGAGTDPSAFETSCFVRHKRPTSATTQVEKRERVSLCVCCHDIVAFWAFNFNLRWQMLGNTEVARGRLCRSTPRRFWTSTGGGKEFRSMT